MPSWWTLTPIIALLFVAFVIVRNSRKFRKEFGSKTTVDQILVKYPRAWVIPLGKKRPER